MPVYYCPLEAPSLECDTSEAGKARFEDSTTDQIHNDHQDHDQEYSTTA